MLALLSNLRRLLAIRAIVFSCQLAALLYSQVVLGLALPYGVLWSILVLFLLLNTGIIWRLWQAWPVGEPEFLGHLLLDVLVLSLLMYFTGGAANPFISYLLVPVTISAATLPWHHTWTVTGVSLLCYSLLLFVYQPLPAFMPGEAGAHDHGTMVASDLNLHITGMWFNFVVSAGLITWFVVKMAAEIRQQQLQLAELREANLRDEQILAIATQAAGTAHELGTPLATMAVLLKEMEADISDPALRQDLATLQQQLGLCRETLRRLASEAELRPAAQQRTVALGQFLRQVVDQWQLLRPEVRLDYDQAIEQLKPLINQDAALQQAIVNLLNNAADASEASIHLQVQAGDDAWVLQIHDQGPGIDRKVQSRLGKGRVTTKAEGLGVGFLLSHATINRLGGTVTVRPHSQQGTLTELRLPLAGEGRNGGKDRQGREQDNG